MSLPLPTENQQSPRLRVRFGIIHLLSLISITAVVLALGTQLGTGGWIVGSVLVGVIVCLLWAKTLLEVLTVTAIVGILIAILLPPVQSARTYSRLNSCKNNLRLLAQAMYAYENDHGSFPPAYIADKSGKPMHSWRVLLLPYLEQEQIYRQYRFDEPWNGPRNSQLTNQRGMWIFQCPADMRAAGRDDTSYVVVTGSGTAFPGDKATKLQQIGNGDGAADTILIVEIHNSGIRWMEPRDLHISQMAPLINAKAGQGISSLHAHGAVVVFADGHVEFLNEKTTAQQLRAMLTIDGGEKVDAR